MARLAVAGCSGDAEPQPMCAPDGAALTTAIEVAEGAACAARTLSIPRRESVRCGALPSGFAGSRLALLGHAGTRWEVRVDRTDGAPDGICAAVFDAACRCTAAACTDGTADRELLLELGVVPEASAQLVLGAGTYAVELCSR